MAVYYRTSFLTEVTMTSVSSYQPPDLKGRVALVAGATRGVGRGTALALGEAGATVYCTGRSTRGKRTEKSPVRRLPSEYYLGRPETIEETAELVTARGGKGIAVVTDHLEAQQVEALLTRIRKEEHTSELQSLAYLVCRLLLEKKKNTTYIRTTINYHN